MKSDYRQKIYDLNGLDRLLSKWKSSGETIVFTNGCFDLLHLGHIDYLEKASRLADHLIVGVNGNASVLSIKGPNRPIQNETSRVALIAGLACVDAVILFDADTPIDLITVIQPHYLVKGGDWKPEQIVGSKMVEANGGKVVVISFLPGYSTTLIEQKIKLST